MFSSDAEPSPSPMDTYDEDLSENPFFQSFLNSCPELFSQCVAEQWLICVPRRDSLPKYAFTFEDFSHHILKPRQQRNESGLLWSGESSNTSNSGSNRSSRSPCGSGTEFSVATSDKSNLSSSFSSSSSLKLQLKGGLKGHWNYVTLTHVNVEYSGRILILDIEIPISKCSNNNNHGSPEKASPELVQLRKEILFDETFYTNDRRKYKVLCIASPLNSKVDLEDKDFGNSGLGIWNLTSLRDCIDFIWVKGNIKILENYDALIKLFLHNHPGLESLPLAIQRDLVKTLYLKCLAYAESTGMTEKENNQPLSEFLQKRLRLATETYVLNGIYRTLISALTSAMSAEDAVLNKVMRNLAEIHPEDLGIDQIHWNNLNRARCETGRINAYSSPLGKLTCIKRILRYLRPDPPSSESESGSNALCTDDLIPIWVYLIIKNPLGNWMAHLEFLRQFRFSVVEEKDENSFYIVTLEASLEHLRTGKILGVSEVERDIGTPSDLGEVWLHALHQSALESGNHHLVEFLRIIRMGTCERLEEAMEEYEEERQSELQSLKEESIKIDQDQLCHPLCNCDKCTILCTPKPTEPELVAPTELRIKEGHTLLHFASMHGRPKMVDYLIGCGADVDATDLEGMTSLHYACKRGHQNALLLLLHGGASISKMCKSLDTPLHIAAHNGHEGCVKALIYYAEHSRKDLDLSARNANGDTPLHFASKWGFQGIVQILAEHGAAITITNSRYTSPIDCAHDIHILRILQRSLQRRNLLQQSHGDFVNVEMVHKEDSGGIVMLISEPTEEKPKPIVVEPETLSARNSRNASRNGSRMGSRNTSRRNSTVTLPSLFLSPGSAPRSRRASTNRNQSDSANSSFNDQTDERLLSVAESLKSDPSCPNFVFDYFEDYDTSEHDHIRKITVENLESSPTPSSFAGIDDQASNRDRNIQRLFSAIGVGDIPLALFYLGIPAEEVDNPENSLIKGTLVPTCHPLCVCTRCLAKNAGLGLEWDAKNPSGHTPLQYSVQLSLTTLVKILIRYGANVNEKSTVEKKTALDFALDKGYHEMEDILIAAGGQVSSSFCIELNSPECEK